MKGSLVTYKASMMDEWIGGRRLFGEKKKKKNEVFSSASVHHLPVSTTSLVLVLTSFFKYLVCHGRRLIVLSV